MLFRIVFSLVAGFVLLASPVQAQTFPTKPIRLIVPFAPGGSVDIIARLIADQISKPLGQTVIVDNRPGAGSAVGSEAAARAAPDGYTLLMGSTSSLAINPILQKLRYDPLRDFAPITLVASVPHVLVVNADLPVANLKEFIAYAKTHSVNYASAGVGTPHYLAGVMLNQMAGLNVVDIPYKGTGPALLDLVGGQVQVMSVDLAPAIPFIKSGKLRVLGIATSSRSALEPDFPTVGEAGLPGFEVTGWYGVVAPAAVPKRIAERLAEVISQALALPETREKLIGLGATPEGGTPDEFGAHMRRETAKWSRVVKESGVKIE